MDIGHGLVFALRIARILGETNGEKGPRELVPIPLAAICAVFLLVLLPVPQLFAGLRKNHADSNCAARGLCATGVYFRPSDDESSCPVYRASRCISEFCPTVQVALAPAAGNDGAAAMATEVLKVLVRALEKVWDMALGWFRRLRRECGTSRGRRCLRTQGGLYRWHARCRL